MRLTGRDAIATALTAGLVALYTAHLAGVGLPLVAGPRALAVVVILLSLAAHVACAGVAGDEPVRFGRAFFTVAFLLGLIAFVAGLAAVITGSGLLLAALVVSTVALWAVSMVRHAAPRRAGEARGTPDGQLV